MAERPGKQLLKRADAPLEFLVEPSHLVLASLVQALLLLPFPCPLLRRRHLCPRSMSTVEWLGSLAARAGVEPFDAPILG
jgi:hypothetical protein